MYVRLGLANPKEGMAEDALNYFRDVAIPVYDQVSGLLGAAACINNEGQLMAGQHGLIMKLKKQLWLNSNRILLDLLNC